MLLRPASRPKYSMFSRAVSEGYRPALCGSTPSRRRTPTLSCSTSSPSTKAEPLSGCKRGIENAQRGALAGAVGAEQAGDAAVLGAKAHAAQRLHGAEPLHQLLGLDHGPGPFSDRKNGGACSLSTQCVSRCRGCAGLLQEIRHHAVHAGLHQLAVSLVLEFQVQRILESHGRFIAKRHRRDRVGGARQQQRRHLAGQRLVEIRVHGSARPVHAQRAQRIELRDTEECRGQLLTLLLRSP